MPFDWYKPDVPPIASGEKAARMYEAELAERAALLLRLGYSRAEAVMRLRTNVAWDFELHPRPSHMEHVEQIVDQVYKRRGTVGGGPPAL